MVSCYALSIVGICLSTWAIIQLTIMGICYTLEAPTLLEDVEDHEQEYIDVLVFKTATEKGYRIVAASCFITAYMYIILMFISIYFALNRRLANRHKAKLLEDDDYYCHIRPKKKCCKRKPKKTVFKVIIKNEEKPNKQKRKKANKTN